MRTVTRVHTSCYSFQSFCSPEPFLSGGRRGLGNKNIKTWHINRLVILITSITTHTLAHVSPQAHRHPAATVSDKRDWPERCGGGVNHTAAHVTLVTLPVSVYSPTWGKRLTPHYWEGFYYINIIFKAVFLQLCSGTFVSRFHIHTNSNINLYLWQQCIIRSLINFTHPPSLSLGR